MSRREAFKSSQRERENTHSEPGREGTASWLPARQNRNHTAELHWAELGEQLNALGIGLIPRLYRKELMPANTLI